MAKSKSKSKALFSEPPVTSYPFCKDRTLVFDWASLAYHQMYSIVAGDKDMRRFELDGPEGEVRLWRTKMIAYLIKMVAIFNPKHIVFALEGVNLWRKDYVKEWYTEHSEVYYNTKEYFVQSDNYTYNVQKADDGTFAVSRLPVSQYDILDGMKHRKLSELPIEKQAMLWNIYTATGDPILPSYKGQRKKKREWKFEIDRKIWMEYKDQFAQELAPLFRARAIRCDIAEGDDIIYAAVKKMGAESEEVIVITHDSDMSQMSFKNLKIFDHRTDTFVHMDNPQRYLDVKVLAGDSSDNINGMAFVDHKTGKHAPTKDRQLGEGTASTLLESCPNIYETSKANNWYDQYMRNKMLIDMSMIPEKVMNVINAELDKPEPALGGYNLLDFWDVPKLYEQSIFRMRDAGFFIFLPVEYIDRNPGAFKRDMYEQKVAEQNAAEFGGVETDNHIITDDTFADDDLDLF